MKKCLCLAIFLASAALIEAQIVLDTFGSPGATGSAISGSSWVGNFSQTSTTMTAVAHNDQGWGVSNLASFNASTYGFVTITAQRDSGNAATTFQISFEDSLLNASPGYTISTSAFAVGSMTTVSIPVTWPTDGSFDSTQVTGWNIGGGNFQHNGAAFNMTFDNMSLTVTAIPEPSTYAAIFGVACLGAAIVRRQKRRAAVAA